MAVSGRNIKSPGRLVNSVIIQSLLEIPAGLSIIKGSGPWKARYGSLRVRAMAEKLPEWLRVRLPTGSAVGAMSRRLRSLGLHTVCEEARCPNQGECWGQGTATLLILGETCTRACRFCAVSTGNPKGRLDDDEPLRVADAVRDAGLRYVVLTSVDRDDLPDGGAGQYARTIRAIREAVPAILVEALIPDFINESLGLVLDAVPDVLGHNIEVVRRLTPLVRDHRCSYEKSLETLTQCRDAAPQILPKSSIMLGLGERDEEIEEALRDLLDAGVRMVTLGQYLQPTNRHHPVVRFVPPEEFSKWEALCRGMGFEFAAAGPLVRSSYRASELFAEGKLR